MPADYRLLSMVDHKPWRMAGRTRLMIRRRREARAAALRKFWPTSGDHIWGLCMSLPDYRQIDDARLAIFQSYRLFRDVTQRMERTQRYDLGLVSRKPPGRPVTDDMSDMETNIQGEIREYYERQQEEHGDTTHFWIQRGRGCPRTRLRNAVCTLTK
jgi:hypothetical protein